MRPRYGADQRRQEARGRDNGRSGGVTWRSPETCLQDRMLGVLPPRRTGSAPDGPRENFTTTRPLARGAFGPAGSAVKCRPGWAAMDALKMWTRYDLKYRL